MNATENEPVAASRETKRKGGWIVALAVLSGVAVVLPSMIALAISLVAAVIHLFA
jgi:hypothetical protein